MISVGAHVVDGVSQWSRLGRLGGRACRRRGGSGPPALTTAVTACAPGAARPARPRTPSCSCVLAPTPPASRRPSDAQVPAATYFFEVADF